ncbi:threonine ammonia-lyase [Pseudoblastomonas halimionae]|uniref:Threonine ammonia-lyase n=1 Tax=Alteriqipengyuania halimionae TaxID=1926630 RepID=A0A6I4U6T0_9SPHN|nr:threonine ammonia-lyase [Alteriqipengyuania halimionae]MXP10162.1 threonine ammonia-lyase [Alteriqipengyuania halimionae]
MTDQTATSHEGLTLDTIRAAAERIEGQVVRTPTRHSRTLSEITGANVWLKFENQQFTASYKERGALNALLQLDRTEAKRGVIAASAGNHSQGLSYHGTRQEIPVTIVMPKSTPTIKIRQTEMVGGNVELFGETFDEAYAHALELEKERNLTFVHPFDDPAVASGQGTVALEMLEDAPELDMLAIPIGGGGLSSGMATAAKALKPGIEVVGVEAQLYPALYNTLNGTDLPIGGDSIAEGIAVKEPGRFTRKVLADLLDDLVLVDEGQIESAIALLLTIEKTVAEGAGASGLAALMQHKEKFAGRNVGIPICGGNIDTRLLANVLLRDLVRKGRFARLRIMLTDRPGELFRVMKLVAEANVNIIDVIHHRVFTALPAKDSMTDVECEARDREQLDGLIQRLRDEGFKVSRVEVDQRPD